MARLTDAIVTRGKAYAQSAPALEISRGGMQGYLPRFGSIEGDGRLYEEWINNHMYIKQNIIPVVLRYPKFFDYMPESDYWIKGYKSLIEELPISIEGLNSGLTVETDEEAVGGGGEFMEEITDVKRERSRINVQIPDKAGKSILRFLDGYIRYGMKDPDVKKPLVSQFFTTEFEMGLYTPDMYSGMVMFIEPDATQQLVFDAWLCFNFYPKGTGERTGRRDLKSPGERNNLSIEFSSITMNNEATHILAQNIMQQLDVLKKIPDTDMLTPTDRIDASIASVDRGFNRK